MLKIGCHLSSSKGYLAMGREAVRIGANTFQFFTRNPRGGKAKPLDLEDVAAYNRFAKDQGLFPILAQILILLHKHGMIRLYRDKKPEEGVQPEQEAGT